MTMAWIDTVDESLISWLASAQALPNMIAVRCLTFDASGHIQQNSLDLDALLPVIAARSEPRWLLSLSNTNEASFVAVRDNTDGAKDVLLSDIRSLRSLYPSFRGLDIRLTSASDTTHRLAVRELIAGLFLQYKHAYTAGHFHLSLPAKLESECSWVDHASFVGYCNTVSLLSQADDKMAQIKAVLQEATAWYPSRTILLAQPGAGRLYTSSGTSEVPFSSAAGFLLGTTRCSEDQPYAAFAGYLDKAEYQTVLLPHVYDYTVASAVFRPRAFTAADGSTMTPESFQRLALVRRYPPTPVVYWRDDFSSANTLENYSMDNGEYGLDTDSSEGSGLHYLARPYVFNYNNRTFSTFRFGRYSPQFLPVR